MDKKTIGQRIRELRLKFNMSQKAFAEKLNVSPAALSKYESGLGNPSISALIEIAQNYNVSVDWLLGISDNDQTNTEIKKYADIIKPLITLTKFKNSPKFTQLYYNGELQTWCLIFDFKYATPGDYLSNNRLNDLLQQLNNVLSLYNSKTIDDNIFFAVIEKLKKDFNIGISEPEEELPF